MELDKMDENDWKYHGEGNKSLVVSHVQVSFISEVMFANVVIQLAPKLANWTEFMRFIRFFLLGVVENS